MAAIMTRGLTKRFGTITAVDNLDMTVEEGEIFGLLGPNGSGKTTLIRMLVGLIRPHAGDAIVLGQHMPNKDILAQIGYMTQAGALYADLTVRENVEFFATMCGSIDRHHVEEVLELVELADRANSLVGTLSGGLKQRASLACALVHRPRLLLLDEPTVGIDPVLRVSFWRYFERLAREGITLVISSHAMDEAERCTRVLFLQNGRALIVGTPTQIRQQAGVMTMEEAFLYYAQKTLGVRA
jgi:ABC-2 type transport system ATP-binding protein